MHRRGDHRQISFFLEHMVIIHHLFNIVLCFPDGRNAAIAVNCGWSGVVGSQGQGEFAFIAVHHLLKIHGSADDVFPRVKRVVDIKGVNVFPSDIETIVRSNPRLTGEYVCVISEEKHMSVQTVEVEKQDDYRGDERELVGNIQNECQKIVVIKPRVVILPAKSSARATHKAKRVRDERGK